MKAIGYRDRVVDVAEELLCYFHLMRKCPLIDIASEKRGKPKGDFCLKQRSILHQLESQLHVVQHHDWHWHSCTLCLVALDNFSVSQVI